MDGQDWSGRIESGHYNRSTVDHAIRLYDTTLRDGEQAPGIAFSKDDKIALAKTLDNLGVDCIEAGFAVSGDVEKDTIRSIVNLGLKADIYSLARCKEKDIDAAVDSGVKHVHMFIATSDIHMRYKLGMSEDEVLSTIRRTVSYARGLGLDIHFSCEDATRSNLDFLKKAYLAAVEAGASSVDIPDTVGISMPDGMMYLVSEIKNIVDVPVAVHCHNDLGLATANSLASAVSGADILHVTMNGIGERAGNAALEEIAVALFVSYGIRTVELSKLFAVSKTVSRYSGYPIAFNKAVVGRNAFYHEAGIHVDGMIKNPLTYESFPPELVGRTSHVALGKLSGEHSIRSRLDSMGIAFPEDLMSELVQNVKNIAISGKDVTDLELAAIAENLLWKGKTSNSVILKEFNVMTGKNATPTATVTITVKGNDRTCAEIGNGPVDAAFNAISRVFDDSFSIEDFRLESITGGGDALCEVTLIVKDKRTSKVTVGKCIGLDIVQTSVDAIMEAINRSYSDQ